MCRPVVLLVLLSSLVASAQVLGGGVFEATPPPRVADGGGTSPQMQSLLGMGGSHMRGFGSTTPLVYAVDALGPGAYYVNYGISNERSPQIVARWFSNEATVCGVFRCTHVWFEGGVEDLRYSTASPADVVATFLPAVDDALAKGYVVAWSGILPCRDDLLCTDAVIDAIREYNGLLLAACATAPRSINPRLRCFSGYDSFVDPARFREDGVTLAGYLLPAYSLNGLRLSNAGAQALGILAASALQD